MAVISTPAAVVRARVPVAPLNDAGRSDAEHHYAHEVTYADQLTAPITEHGEGPVWWPDGHLRCVDMLAGDLVDVHDDASITRTHISEVAAVVRPRSAGGAVVAVERGIVLLDSEGRATRQPDVWSYPGVRMNDGGCDPDGRFYCGSMAYDETPGRGSLYRFDEDGTAMVILAGVTISNGFAFAPDGSTAYYADTPTQRVDAFDYDYKQGLTRRRSLITIPPDAGSPDGITVDGEGGIWVACWGGGAVRRYHPDGSLDTVIDVPDVKHVTACTLGGPDLNRLYITTSRTELDPTEAGEAGAIFIVDDVIPGRPVQPTRL
jgi:sugar lactone lactonase YvrE